MPWTATSTHPISFWGDWLETCRGLVRRIVASRRRPRLRPSRAQPAWEFPRYASVYADGFELVRHRVGDGGFTAVGHQDRRAVSGMQREQMHSRLQLRRLRIELVHVFRTDRLDVGDLSAAENGECLLVHCHFFRFASGSLTHGPRLLSGFVGRVRTQVQLSSRHSCSAIWIVLMTRAGSGRARSIESSPFFRSAFCTSIPSASTKVRWNWRAAMPRCRYCRTLSSCWRPRMTSSFSSTVTSS